MKQTIRFSIFYFLFSFLLASTTLAQIPAGIDPNNLSTVRVDELSDDQIRMILKQAGGAGVSIDAGAQMAVQRGLPSSEVEKFKARVAKLQNATPASTGNAATPTTASPADVIEKENNVKEAEIKAETGAIKEEASKTPEVKTTVYGQEYFRKGDIKIFDKSTDAKAPSNYVIGIDDEIGISVFGNSYYNEVLKVDSRGAINPQQMGPVFVKGLTYEKAKGLIRAKMAQFFDLSNNRLEVTLAYSRSITVNIVGEVMKPGSYKLPALNTAFNALILAGGPNDIGTLRAIEIRRNGKTIRTLDVYAFLNDPKSNQDFYLEDNDYIVVVPAKKLVRISGEVKRNFVFELLEKEQLNELIKYAGGLNADAYTERISVRRKSVTEITILDVNYDSLLKIKKNFSLANGDEITIRSTLTELRNVLNISGAVNFPGEYNFSKGLKISDLIKKAGGLKAEAYLQTAYLVRTNDDLSKKYIEVDLSAAIQNEKSAANILLEKRDVLRIYSSRDYVDPFTISINGAVRKAVEFDYAEGARLQDAIRNAEGLRIDADMQNAYIIRTLDNDDKIYLRINLTEAMANKNSEQNVLLMPRDQIKIYSLRDFVENSSIRVYGAVKDTGDFAFVRGMTLADALRNAGGFKIEAENLRIEISRLSYFSANYKDGQEVRVIIEKTSVDSLKNFLNDTKAQFVLQPYDQVFVRTVPNFDFQQNITINGEVKYPGVYSLLSKEERISDIISRSGGLTRFAFTEGATLYRPDLPGGFIVLKLDNALFRKGSRYNYVLKEGDRLNIPTVTDFISIRGSAIQYIEVTDRAQVNAPFHSGKRAKFFINKYGNGFSKEAWKKKTYVIQPNAKINRTKDFIVFKIYPKVTKGSTIYVIQKEKKPEEIKKEREPFNWNQFIERTTVKITGLATLYILLRQL